MDITKIRVIRNYLQQRIDYCPPDDAPLKAFESAEASAISAAEQYEDLEYVFALVDAIDQLTGRLDQVEENLACSGRGQSIAWTCPHCGFGNAGAPGIEGKDWDFDAEAEQEAHDYAADAEFDHWARMEAPAESAERDALDEMERQAEITMEARAEGEDDCPF